VRWKGFLDSVASGGGSREGVRGHDDEGSDSSFGCTYAGAVSFFSFFPNLFLLLLILLLF